MLHVDRKTFNFLLPRNENSRRGVANDKYQKMRTDLEAEKGKTAFLKEHIIKSKRLFFLSFSYSDLVLCQHSPILTVYYSFSDLQKPFPRLRILSNNPSTFSSWIAKTRSLRRRGRTC